MPTRRQTVRHVFDGGWASDFGPATDVSPDQNGVFRVPFLIDAENCLFELSGGLVKSPGTERLNLTAISGSEEVLGIWDFWLQGTAASGTQKRLAKAGTVLYKDDADGTWDSLITGLTDNAIPSFTVFNDLGIYSETGADVPKKYNQSTTGDLGTNTPNFSFAVPHKNRLWAAGATTNAGDSSRVFYSQLDDADTDWSGSGSGSIGIDIDDGDRIMGLVSHKDQLWVFKGPYHGSIHRITGSSPTGSDSFARKTFMRGLGAAGHNSIFPFKDDIGFIWSDGTIHSLQATAAFGDFQEASLSFPINDFLRTRVNHDRIDRAWTAVDVSRGIVMIVLPIDTENFPNAVLVMDHRFDPIRWSFLNAFDVNSIAKIIDPTNNNRPTIMMGGSDGFVRIWDKIDRSIDPLQTAGVISAKVTLPFLNYGIPLIRKTLAHASLSIDPRGDYGATFSWQRDTSNRQSDSIVQGGGDVLGPSDSNPFVIGFSALSGAAFIERSMDLSDGGEFGAVQYQVTQNGANEELRLRAITTTIEIGTMSLEDM